MSRRDTLHASCLPVLGQSLASQSAPNLQDIGETPAGDLGATVAAQPLD